MGNACFNVVSLKPYPLGEQAVISSGDIDECFSGDDATVPLTEGTAEEPTISTAVLRHRVIVSNTNDKHDELIAKIVADVIFNLLLERASHQNNTMQMFVDHCSADTIVMRHVCHWINLSHMPLLGCELDAPVSLANHCFKLICDYWDTLDLSEDHSLAAVEISIVKSTEKRILKKLEMPAECANPNLTLIQEYGMRMMRLQTSIKQKV
jgi:hypothetical protein